MRGEKEGRTDRIRERRRRREAGQKGQREGRFTHWE